LSKTVAADYILTQ